MEADALISIVLNYTDNTDALDADNAGRRARILQYIQEVVNFVWFYRPWSFSFTTGSTTVTSAARTDIPGSAGELPSDFNQLTKYGKVYRTTDSVELVEIPQHQLLTARLDQMGGTTDNVEEFSIFGMSGANKRLIQTVNPTSTLSLSLYYRKAPPTIVDDDADSELTQIPYEYHNGVILPGVIAKTRVSKGDSRNFQATFMENLAYMTAAERPLQTAVQKMPRGMGWMW